MAEKEPVVKKTVVNNDERIQIEFLIEDLAKQIISERNPLGPLENGCNGCNSCS